MLVLSRKSHEQIQIGPNIFITIVEVRGNQVRLGIDAPVNVAVMRTELLERLATSSPTATVASAASPTSPATESKSTATRRRVPRADSSPLSDHPHRSGPASSSTAIDRARNRLFSSSQRSTRAS